MILLIGNHCLKERAFSDKLLLMEGESANALIETVMVIHDLLIKAVAEFPPLNPANKPPLRVFASFLHILSPSSRSPFPPFLPAGQRLDDYLRGGISEHGG